MVAIRQNSSRKELKMNIKKIAGVVVIYNPNESVLHNIDSYKKYVDHLFVVDNSEKKNEAVISSILHDEKCEYIDNDGNAGVASALNVGARKAISSGADWLLTMDQDSSFNGCSFNYLLDGLNVLEETGAKVGVVSPAHKEIYESGYADKTVVMTSGNLVNLRAYEHIGGFEEKLFIDAVDYDFCLRLIIQGYKVLQVNQAVLTHALGDPKIIKLLGRLVTVHSHSPLRRYYMTRNALYYWSRYFFKFPTFILLEMAKFSKNFVEILFVSNQKLKDLSFMLKGVSDFFRGRYGKFERADG